MNKAETATKLFTDGFNCAQAVLATYAEELGLERELALKLVTALAAGVAKRGQMCGALLGALLVVGLKYGRCKIEDLEAKANTFFIADELIFRFEQSFGTSNCKQLLGFDPNSPEGQKNFNELKLHLDICPKFVKKAVEILEELL